MPWLCLILFAAGFIATVFATPWVIHLAHRLGAIDAPDGFRKTHAGATPRTGGLAIAFGLAAATGFAAMMLPAAWSVVRSDLALGPVWMLLGLGVVLTTGFLDDRRGLSPGAKLIGQALAGGLLFLAGVRIERVFLFGMTIDFGLFAVPATCFWFLGCMNIWNLIDGLDGLASGVGLIVSLTLLLAGYALEHLGVAYASAALAGTLAGFLMFNFHPAKIFLGDTGSMWIGTLLGMLAIRGSLKSGMTVAILVPILVMGLPIVDTLLAIVRRWIRHLPWNVADRGHLHHRLLALGLSTRQASLFLYSFTLLLCGSALASLALQSDSLAMTGALVGTLALLGVFAARREQRAGLLDDFRRRLVHRTLEQRAARCVWEAIQRLSTSPRTEDALDTLDGLADAIGLASVALDYQSRDSELLKHDWQKGGARRAGEWETTLRLNRPDRAGGRLGLEFRQQGPAELPLSLGARFLERFADALAETLRPPAESLWSSRPASCGAEAPDQTAGSSDYFAKTGTRPNEVARRWPDLGKRPKCGTP